MDGQGKQLSQTQQRSRQLLSNIEFMKPGLIDQYLASRGGNAAVTATNAPQRASEMIVDDPAECAVCFVTKQCCIAALDQKTKQLTAEDAQKLKHSVCIDHSSQAPGTEASKAMVEDQVKMARKVIDLYMQPLP